jgi:hypothetical protein
MEYPQVKHLYKYGAYNTNSLSILINKKIWVAKPDSFNDPFDCKIRFKSEINSDAFRKYLDRTGRTSGNLHKDYEIFQEGLEKFRDIHIRNLGVFSMSQIKDNILMWSHYADQHNGFCIEFNRSPNNDLGDFEKTQPVNYYCDYPEVDPLDSNGYIDPSIHKKMLFSKAKDWAYEKEWRLTYDEGDKEAPMPGDISSIIFGLRMPDQHKNTIRNILADHRAIRYQKAIEVEYEFRLKIVDL